jgi:hypothetical protein
MSFRTALDTAVALQEELHTHIMDTFKKYWERFEAWDYSHVMWQIDPKHDQINFKYTDIDGYPASLSIHFDWFTDWDGMCEKHPPREWA